MCVRGGGGREIIRGCLEAVCVRGEGGGVN